MRVRCICKFILAEELLRKKNVNPKQNPTLKKKRKGKWVDKEIKNGGKPGGKMRKKNLLSSKIKNKKPRITKREKYKEELIICTIRTIVLIFAVIAGLSSRVSSGVYGYG